MLDAARMQATLDVPADDPFAGRVLLPHLHGTLNFPGGAADPIAFGLKSGDRVSLRLGHFIPEDCSYSLTKIAKLTT